MIAILIVGILIFALFVFWERYLERVQNDSVTSGRWWTPPPLMNVSIWGRASGKLGVMLIIAFLQWCGFISFSFWITVRYPNIPKQSTGKELTVPYSYITRTMSGLARS